MRDNAFCAKYLRVVIITLLMLLVTHQCGTNYCLPFPLLYIWPLSLIEVGLVGVQDSLAGNHLIKLELHMVPSQHIIVPFICFDGWRKSICRHI